MTSSSPDDPASDPDVADASPDADPDAALAEWLAEASARGRDHFDAETLVAQTLSIVADAEHVSVSVRSSRRGWTTLAASSELAGEADQLQYSLGEGPCVEAAETGEWFRSRDVARDERWPRWGPRAAELGIGSILGVRLLSDGRPFGALNMYAAEAGRFADRDDVDLALIWSTHAAYTLATARTIEHLETALSSRHAIGLAQGMLMERFSLDETGAFMLLRRISSHRNQKLREVAADLIRTGELPDASPEPRP